MTCLSYSALCDIFMLFYIQHTHTSCLPGSFPLEKASESSWYVSCRRINALAAPVSSSSSGKYCLCTDMLETNPGQKVRMSFCTSHLHVSHDTHNTHI